MSRAGQNATRSVWLAALSAALLALIVYAITLSGTLVYDDKILDIDLRYSTPHYWYLFWIDQYWPHGIDNLYRPLACMTFAVQKWLHGDLAWPYHLVNWLLHAAVSAMVALLANRLSNLRAAWIAGLLFAAHPIHVEVVAGIVGRLDVMCALPMLLAMYLFSRPMTARRVVAIVACFFCAVLSKESGLLLPLILLAMLPWRRPLLTSFGRALSSDKIEIEWTETASSSEDRADATPLDYATTLASIGDKRYMRALFVSLSWSLAGYLIFRESILRFWWPRSLMYWTGNPMVLSQGMDRVLMPFVLLGRCVALLIAPLHLSVDYGSMVIGWQVRYREPYIYIGLAAAALWLAILGWSIRRRRWQIFAVLMALALSYGLTSNAISLIGTIFAERLTYLPSAFFLILIGILASRLRAGIIAPCLALLTLAASWHAFVNARLWNDPLALFTTQLHDHPRSLKLYDLVREQYAIEGDAESAQKIGHLCIQNLPDVFEAYMLCADTALAAGDIDDADRVAHEGYAKFQNVEMKAWVNKIRDLRRQQILKTRPTS